MRVSWILARLRTPTLPLATRFVLQFFKVFCNADERSFGVQAALSNPNVSEEAKEHSAEILDNLRA